MGSSRRLLPGFFARPLEAPSFCHSLSSVAQGSRQDPVPLSGQQPQHFLHLPPPDMPPTDICHHCHCHLNHCSRQLRGGRTSSRSRLNSNAPLSAWATVGAQQTSVME